MDSVSFDIKDFRLVPNVENIHRLIKTIGHTHFTVNYGFNDKSRIGKMYIHNRNIDIGYFIQGKCSTIFDFEYEIADMMIGVINEHKNKDYKNG